MSTNLVFIDQLRERLQHGAPSLPDSPSRPAEPPGHEHTVFALDRSGSMGDGDYPPSRLKAGVAAIGEFITARLDLGSDDLVAAVVFDSAATVVCAKTHLRCAEHDILRPLSEVHPYDGTDIGQGLIAAETLLPLRERGFTQRVVLLTDGHGGHPEARAKQLKAKGVIIDVIGIGGSPAAVNEASLRKVASVVGGETRYRFIGDRGTLLNHFRAIATDLVSVR